MVLTAKHMEILTMSTSSLILSFLPTRTEECPRRGPRPRRPKREGRQVTPPPHNRQPGNLLSSLQNWLDKRFCLVLALLATFLSHTAVHLARHRLLEGSKVRVLLRGGAWLNRAAISRMRHGRW